MLRSVLRHQPLDCCCIAKLLARGLQTFSNLPLDPDSEALHLIRQCCRAGPTLEQAKQLHSAILQSGVKGVQIFSKYLIRMYASCGSLQEARKAFEEVQHPDVVSWTEIITAYARNGLCDQAFCLFRRMLHEGAHPDIITVLAVLYACKDSSHLEQGRLAHDVIAESGYETDMAVGDRLLLMYERCGGAEDGRRLFLRLRERRSSSGTATMKMLVREGESEQALKLFAGLDLPRKLDFITALQACTSASQVGEVHQRLTSSDTDICSSLASALVEAYARCGGSDKAVRLLKKRWSHDASCWTGVISALARRGEEREALEVFHKMQRRSVKPVAGTFVAVLEACAGLGALIEGRLIHRRIVEEEKLEIDASLAASLVSMYSRCLSLEEACSVFTQATTRDVRLWGSLIGAFAAHGQGYAVITLFRKMQQEGLRPDEESFSGVLSILCQNRMFEAGCGFFAGMRTEHGHSPALSCFVRMTELLGRAGELDEAERLINGCPFKSSSALWMSYLSACRCRGDLERGKLAAVRIFSLDPSRSPALVVLSRIYEREGRLDLTERLKKVKRDREPAARSWIEIKGIVHEFTAGDQSHPQSEEIQAAVEKLAEVVDGVRTVGGGRTTDGVRTTDGERLVMHDVEEETEDSLWLHSERMALVLGLMSSDEEERLVIFKSRRVCGDCHAVLAVVSRLSRREIVVRDSARVHCFSDGVCSCGDFW